MPNTLIPLTIHQDANAPIIYRLGEAISQQQFLRTITAIKKQLPKREFVINLCEDRTHFLLTFAAALANDSSNILPPNRQPKTIKAITEDYPEHTLVIDSDQYQDLPNCIDIRTLNLGDSTDSGIDTDTAEIENPQIKASHIAAIAFTSGSTGKPKANKKEWRTLSGTAKLLGKRFAPHSPNAAPHIVATVPSQHMYGLEMTVMMALQTQCVMVSAHPFFPQDIANALEKTPEPRILVTTPIHLRALLGSNITIPPLARIISATAPMTSAIAEEAEKRYGVAVEEIYGCTEAGSLATRQTLKSENWKMLDGITVEKQDDTFVVNAPHLAQTTPLQDRLEITADNTFRLLGRSADMLNVGGKRASLADLNQKLLEIDGVDDGVIFLVNKDSTDKQRPAALVVSKTLSAFDIQQILAKQLDPVFLPRPLRIVPSLHRSSTGKLPIEGLLSTLAAAKHDSE